MDIADIRASGLLELYVMDQLSPAEKAEVETYLHTYPELRQDLAAIEQSLEWVARGAAKPAPPHLKENILREIRHVSGPGHDGGKKKGTGKSWGALSIAALLLGGVTIVTGYLWMVKDNEVESLHRSMAIIVDSCAQTQQRLTEQLRILQQLTYPENQIIPFSATPGFASTDLYLHHNEQTRRNFIQVRNLPAKTADQQFQLWALKPEQPPTPLDVFDVPDTGLIEVAYVDDAPTYAITIEPRGGRETPTLENLIGTVNVRG